MSVHESLARVCVNGECVQRSVSSCRAWNGRERRAVSAPHPESPLETNPSYRDEPPPRIPASLSLVHASLSTHRFALFLSPFFHAAPCNPLCRCVLSHVEENPMKRGEKRASLKNRGSMNGEEILPALKSEISLHILLYYHYMWYWFRESWNLSKERISSVDGTFFR